MSNMTPFNLQTKLINAVLDAESAIGTAVATTNNIKPKKTVEDLPNLKKYMMEENCKTLEETLFRAIDFSRVDIITNLVQCGVNVNANKTDLEYYGATPLFMTLLRAFKSTHDAEVHDQHGLQISRETCIRVMNILVEANADVNVQPVVWLADAHADVNNQPVVLTAGRAMGRKEQISYLNYIVESEVAVASAKPDEDPKLSILEAYLKYKPRVNEIIFNMGRYWQGRHTVFSTVLDRVYKAVYPDHDAPSRPVPVMPVTLSALKVVINLLIANGIQDYEKTILNYGEIEDPHEVFQLAVMLKSYPLNREHTETVHAIADALFEDMSFQALTGMYPEYKCLISGAREKFGEYCVRTFFHCDSYHLQAHVEMMRNVSDKAWETGEYLTNFGSIVREKLSTYDVKFSAPDGPTNLVLQYSAPYFPNPSAHPALIFSIMKEGLSSDKIRVATKRYKTPARNKNSNG